MDQQQLREFAESIGMVDAESLDTASAEVDRLDKYRLENITEADAKRYAFTLGVQDTVRGIGQALATGEEGQYESDRQALLNHLKHRYPDSAKYHFIGMIADPTLFAIPGAKAGLLKKGGPLWGAMAGGATGMASYHHPSIESLLIPGEPMSRTESAVLGSTIGGTLGPALSVVGKGAKRVYDPYGHKVWESLKRKPIAGLSAGAALYGYHADDDQNTADRLKDGFIYALTTGGSLYTGKKVAPKLSSAVKDKLGRFAIAKYSLPDEFLDMQAISVHDRNVMRRDLETVTEQLQALPDDVRRAMYHVLSGTMEADEAYTRLTLDQIKLLHTAEDKITEYGQKLVGLGVLDEDTWLKNVGRYMHQTYVKLSDEDKASQSLRRATFGGGNNIASQGDALRMSGHRTFIPAEQWKVDKDYYLGTPSTTIQAQRVDARTGELINPDDYHRYPEGTYSIVNNPVGPRTNPPSGSSGPLESTRGWEVVDENATGVTLRRPWSLKEQRSLGLVEDAALGFQATARLLANDISAYKFYQAVADTYGRKISPEMGIPDGYRFVPSTRIGKKGAERYGALAGTVIPENIYHDIVSMDAWRRYGAGGKISDSKWGENPSRVWNGYRALNRWWKATKTVLNAPVHVGNVTSNIMHYDLMGGSLGSLRQGRLDMRDNTARFRLAEDWDVFGGTLASNEIMRKNKSLYDAYQLDGVDTMDKFILKSTGIAKKLAQGVKVGKEQTFDRLVSLYQWEDYIFRMGLFNSRITEGAERLLRSEGIRPNSATWKTRLAQMEKDPPIDIVTRAAKEAREGFVDYGKNSPFTYAMKDSFIPFISYTWGIVPRLAESAVKRPEKIAKWSLILGGMNQMFHNISEDQYRTDAEIAKMSSEDRATLFGLPDSARLTVGPLPKRFNPYSDTTGESAYLKVHRMIPGGHLTAHGEEKTGVVPGVPGPLQPGGVPLTIFDAIRGKESFTNEEMATLGQRGKFLARQFLPNVPIPGTGTWAGEKLRRGFVPRSGAYRHPFRDTQTPPSSVLQNLGIRVTPYNLLKLKDRIAMDPKWDRLDRIDKELQELYGEKASDLWHGKSKEFGEKVSKLEKEQRQLEKERLRAILRSKPRDKLFPTLLRGSQ